MKGFPEHDVLLNRDDLQSISQRCVNLSRTGFWPESVSLRILSGYLGENETNWRQYDASLLLAQQKSDLPILVDQGDADQFLTEQLKPDVLQAASAASGSALELRIQPGYDHSYYFIASFIEDHLRFHARYLNQEA
ncbi:alpha/beta hydrolase-fold protein [Marinospirillum sp.]|uniref:alpha/beta hydrolase-fold protein n=1 Tax=Marinospirillum sp. TaxID=2183934 RepID=UPI00345815C7